MAIVVAVPEKTQSKTAMSKVMQYVAQEKKTLYENADGQKYKLLSGQNCCGDTAFKEFMATKRQYGKEKGVYFYQYVQSFKPDVKATSQEIHKMGIELARYFEGFEVQIATHIDRDHWHNHLIVNSVSSENGKKLQFNEKDLIKLRVLSDEICVAHGLEILKPYEKSKQKPISAREYRAAVRGNSWKFKLMAAIDGAMAQSRSKAEFIAHMERLGYKVKWEPNHKYITYTTPDGKPCRDNRLHDAKYLKMEMEGYYAKLGGIKENQFGRTGAFPALSAADMRHTAGAMGSYAEPANRDGTQAAGAERLHRHLANGRRYRTDDAELLPIGLRRSNQYAEEENLRGASEDDRYDECEFPEHDEYDSLEDWGDYPGTGEQAQAQGHVGTEAESQVVRAGGVDLNDILYLAKTLEDMVNPYNPEEECEKKKKYVPKAEKKKHKKKTHNHSNDYDMSL